jgi:hypothetical protein
MKYAATSESAAASAADDAGEHGSANYHHHPLPQSRDVRRVVFAVPGVQLHEIAQRHRPALRMLDGAIERRGVDRFHELHPALMNAVDNRE